MSWRLAITRTRCVATKLKGGHAHNALPQQAEAKVNCRILPGVEPKIVQAELQSMAGPGVGVTPARTGPHRRRCRRFARTWSTPTPGRFARASRQQIIPQMSTGATDGLEFRARGIPVYGVNGAWGVSPDDERAHGKDDGCPSRRCGTTSSTGNIW